jgi:RNA polymerase sigma-70 factor, ECF subfamily
MLPQQALSALYQGVAAAADLPPGLDERTLDERLGALVDEARAAHPNLSTGPAAFVNHLALRLPPGDFPWPDARAADLYLTCACMLGEARAIATLEASYFGDLGAALGRMRLSREQIEELKQSLRDQLFVGPPGSTPRIGEYAGRGELRGWLRVTATRAALKVHRRLNHEAPAGDERLLEQQAPGDDPELAFLKERYRPAFKQAFQEALEGLADRDRLLLRQSVVDGLSIDELGALHQVHRATAARWVAKAREELIDGTRARLMALLRVDRLECESILRMVHSQLDGTIRRRLQSRLPCLAEPPSPLKRPRARGTQSQVRSRRSPRGRG